MVTYTPADDRIVHNAVVDFCKRSISKPVHIVQYDSGLPVLAVNLYLNGNEYIIPVNTEANIRFSKNDGSFVYNPALGCNEERNTVYFEITQQMTARKGSFSPIVELKVNDNIAGSSNIEIEIDRNPIQEGDIESSTEFISIQESVERAENAAINASKYASEAESNAEKFDSKADKIEVEEALLEKSDINHIHDLAAYTNETLDGTSATCGEYVGENYEIITSEAQPDGYYMYTNSLYYLILELFKAGDIISLEVVPTAGADVIVNGVSTSIYYETLTIPLTKLTDKIRIYTEFGGSVKCRILDQVTRNGFMSYEDKRTLDNAASVDYVCDKIGDIDSALEAIILLQKGYVGGDLS